MPINYMRSQVSAELLIVIAVLAALAFYLFSNMQSSSESLMSKYRSASQGIEEIISEMESGASP